MKSLTVVHCLTSLDFGGVEKHMEILADASHNGEMIHRFVAIQGGGAAERALSGMGVQVDCLNRKASIPSLIALLALYRFFREVGPAVVHTHGAEANFHGLIAAKLAGVPVRIGEEIGIPQHSIYAKWIFTQVYRVAHRVIGISNAVTQWLIESGEVAANNAVRLYNPVQLPSEISRALKTSNVFRIGFVGRLEPVKNPLVLVDALALLLAQGISAELCIVGDGSQRGIIESRIAELNLGHKVHLAGYQSDPIPFMLECDIYVQPSISEGFGLALVEAMGCSLPVIATCVGGAPEIIFDGKNGWLLHDSSADAVAFALQKAFNCGSNMLFEMGKEARYSILERFIPANYLQELESLYSCIYIGNINNSRRK
ncbi:MAG: glycosyltransferase [Gallionella sp.]|nr:glycosyltransferase [Gallionella sp.]